MNLNKSLLPRVCVTVLFGYSALTNAQQYDVVFQNARVIDPETKLDAIRSVAISGDKIAAVSKTPLKGKKEINASGLILGPGFINLHDHAMSTPSFWMQAFDGQTTGLELEMGYYPIKQAYENVKKLQLPLNYGFSASWVGVRLHVTDGVEDVTSLEKATANFAKPNWSKLISPEQSAQVTQLLEQELLSGGLGIGYVPGYAPDTNRDEFVAIGKLSAKYDVPIHAHLRYETPTEPGDSIEAFVEAVGVAAGTDARLHLCHINSTSLRRIGETTALVEKGQNKKVRLTTEAYPYGAGETVIGAPFIWPSQLPGLGITSKDIYAVDEHEYPQTPERLAQIQKQNPGGLAIIHYLYEYKPDQMKFVDEAILYKDTMLASDAQPFMHKGAPIGNDVWPIPDDAYTHPRSVANYSTILSRYVRDQKSMTLIDAFRRGSLMPADLVALSAPSAKKKGRIQPGMDADVIVFDLNKIEPMATYDNPRLKPKGMQYVMVNGQLVIDNGVLQQDVRPGRPIIGEVKPKKS